MQKVIFCVGLGAVLLCRSAAIAEQAQTVAVVRFDDEVTGEPSSTVTDSALPENVANDVAPVGAEQKQASEGRYRYHNGHWWYRTDEGRWLWRNGNRWEPYQARSKAQRTKVTATAVQAPAAAADMGGEMPQAPGPGERPIASSNFNQWFNAYRGFQTGRVRLGTAEAGHVELATSEIAAGEGAEAMEVGGIPRSQARRRRPGVGTGMPGSGAWFNSGSPFGIRYGYGSGFGYGGYGYDNPYGYGSRSGSGGAYGYGFAAFGSVGGQTGERLSSLIGGPSEEGGRLIGPEPPSFAAPARLETAVGGTYGKAGAGARQLGGSAAERD